MQEFSSEFARTEVTPQVGDVEIGDSRYVAELQDGEGWVVETGPTGETRYQIDFALGGKNVYYFLTPMERGRLQVLPLAYDVREQVWYDTTASMVRHFFGVEDEALDWREQPLTFNTSCYSCHVSQLSTNYDLGTDTYSTEWAEPGINCETCHGPGGEHARVFREAPEGTVPEDIKIIRTSDFTAEQLNDLCATCHAKMSPLTDSFTPGDRFFDHFFNHALEHPDYYPDGRDLGENFTQTPWLLSPCAVSGELDCIHCHTSSGRNRHTGDEADNACRPCHDQYVNDPAAHSFHAAESSGSRCVACHMPSTFFARMERHDHSMLPPTPAATIAFESPNACNICHEDQTAEWADRWVREWYPTDYQSKVLHRAALVDAARKEDWSRLPEMLSYISSDERDQVFSASLIRLLAACPDPRKVPVLVNALKDESPLVRSSAASSLQYQAEPEVLDGLLAALRDDYRGVRIEAARAMARYPRERLNSDDRRALASASGELEASLKVRPDNWVFHYNLGNYYVERGQPREALEAFKTASLLDSSQLMPLVNASMIHARLGNNTEAERKLRRALKIESDNPQANFNLGLLLAEQGDRTGAERCLRSALESDPELAEAAFNLGVLVSQDRLDEAVRLTRKAFTLRPDAARYGYTYAFYLSKQGNLTESASVLHRLVEEQPEYSLSYALLASVYERLGQRETAKKIYRQALATDYLSARERYEFQLKLGASN
jgi:tetratricopeptide (TPR) repeat protein